MKRELGVLFGLLLAGANAMACYTVYDGNARVVYRGLQAPVDMSLPLHEALEGSRYPAGSSVVFDQSPTCTPVSIAQVARPADSRIPPNTIRMERTGQQLSPSSAAPLLTDRKTAQRQHLPYTQVAGDVVMVPPHAAARVDMPTLSVIPGTDTAVATSAPSVDTRAMGAGPAYPPTVITEMRDPPVTIIQRGGSVSVQR